MRPFLSERSFGMLPDEVTCVTFVTVHLVVHLHDIMLPLPRRTFR